MVFRCRICRSIVVFSRDGQEAWDNRMCRLCHEDYRNARKEMVADLQKDLPDIADKLKGSL